MKKSHKQAEKVVFREIHNAMLLQKCKQGNCTFTSNVSDPDPYWIRTQWPSGSGYVFRTWIQTQVLNKT